MSLGESLKFFREKKGYTQKKVAKICHISAKAISRYENNKAEPDLETLQHLISLYNMDANDLLRGYCEFDDLQNFNLRDGKLRLQNVVETRDKKREGIASKVLGILMETEENYDPSVRGREK
ncbi:MAG: helix-turn-helix domain-containing protein [Anaerorhabdus sp.]